MKTSTETSSFGSSGRVNHNSHKFYNSQLYKGLYVNEKAEYEENSIPKKYLNKVIHKSSEMMNEIPDDSISVMITSPPYNVKKDYDEDLSLDEYLGMLERVWKETYRVLIHGGRACINIANLGRKPYIPLHSYIIDMMHKRGFLMRGEIIWNKGSSSGSSTAWGSWRSASNPVFRDLHEYILVFCKGTFSRQKKGRKSTIGRDDFLKWTKSVWEFPSVSARKIGHPAPFPEELPHRLVQLFTFENEVVLDPFSGSGTTLIAALKSGRNYIGYETKAEYVKLIKKRVSDIQTMQLKLDFSTI